MYFRQGGNSPMQVFFFCVFVQLDGVAVCTSSGSSRVCVCVCVCVCSPALVIYVALIWSLSTMYGYIVRSSDVCSLASRVLQFRSPWSFGL